MWWCLWWESVGWGSQDQYFLQPTASSPPGRTQTVPILIQTNKPGSGSSSFSLRRGNAGRRDSGYFRNTLYIISTAFFRMYGLVCDICRSKCYQVHLTLPCTPACSPPTMPPTHPCAYLPNCPGTPLCTPSHNCHVSPPFPRRKPSLLPWPVSSTYTLVLQPHQIQRSYNGVLRGTKTCLPVSMTLGMPSAG